MLATLIQSAPVYDACWWLAALWFFRTLCLWSFFWAGCPCCGACTCIDCNSDDAACEYQVDIPALNAPGCASCGDYDGTFVVSQPSAVVIGDCNWSYTLPSPSCTFTGGNCGFGLTCTMDTLVFFMLTTGPNYLGALRWVDSVTATNPSGLTWNTDFGTTKPTCLTFSGEEIGTLNATGNATACTPGSNPTVTAI
jgi:hypothetical protein